MEVSEPIQVVLSPLDRGPPDAAYPKYSQGAGAPHFQENAPPYDPTVGLRLWSYGGPRGGTAVSYVGGAPVTARGGRVLDQVHAEMQGLLEIKDTHRPRTLR